MRNIALLGSTGSIGSQTLQVIEQNPQSFCLHSLAANRQAGELAGQARRFRPKRVAITDKSCYNELKEALQGLDIEVLAGEEGLSELAADPGADMVFNALVGFAGLRYTLTALKAEKLLALANKESLVAGGHLVMSLAAGQHGPVIPVDSEHSAIFQCLLGQDRDSVDKLILTASGGPFFGCRRDQLEAVSPAAAMKHPNYAMGAKITIDSASMMNKGLEVIEAHWLFDLPYEKIEVIIQRESIIHSMVEFKDGAVLAQLSPPDMRLPIQYALSYPRRLRRDAPRVNWRTLNHLTFSLPDRENFPCLDLAYSAGKAGGSLPAVLNAANEEAVSLFLGGIIGFMDIPRIIAYVMNKHKLLKAPDFDDLVQADAEARILAHRYVSMSKG